MSPCKSAQLALCGGEYKQSMLLVNKEMLVTCGTALYTAYLCTKQQFCTGTSIGIHTHCVLAIVRYYLHRRHKFLHTRFLRQQHNIIDSAMHSMRTKWEPGVTSQNYHTVR